MPSRGLAAQATGRERRRQNLSASPDRFGRVLPCSITNSALPNAPRSRCPRKRHAARRNEPARPGRAREAAGAVPGQAEPVRLRPARSGSGPEEERWTSGALSTLPRLIPPRRVENREAFFAGECPGYSLSFGSSGSLLSTSAVFSPIGWTTRAAIVHRSRGELVDKVAPLSTLLAVGEADRTDERGDDLRGVRGRRSARTGGHSTMPAARLSG